MRFAGAVMVALLVGGWPLATAAQGQHDAQHGAGHQSARWQDAGEQSAGEPGGDHHGANQQGTRPDGESHHHHAAPSDGSDDAGRQPSEPGLPPHLPVLTDADRAAAFPDLEAHAGHHGGIHTFLLADRFEWRQGGGHTGAALEGTGWIGGDLNRLWLRVDGEGTDGRVTAAGVQALYGRPLTRWWDLVAGIRQDVRPGSPETWLAIGVQGLAPYWFEVEATAFVSTGGQTHVRLETEYDLLLTNRLILQPQLEVDVFGQSDPSRGRGAGLSAADWGLRLRYELRRELAPYVGIIWHRTFGATRDLSHAAGDPADGPRVALGLRVWF